MNAQTIVSGKVNDQEGEPIIGATVVSGTSGALTDENGAYSFTVEGNSAKIKAMAMGYKTVEIEITLDGKTAVADFSLANDFLGLDEVVVTGVVNPKSKLESSVSVSTLNPKQILEVSATNTTEILRSIPGIRSESSGGDGNANITARGVPISAGGSKYLQLQEDGLPILSFGDIAFATSDIFLRADNTVDRLEVIRGGSASTMASNSPAGIVNFVSKTGATRGGSVSASVGLNYNNFRTDFNVGTPISDDLSFNVGGFFRQGTGPRTAGYTANYGGQIKANLTKRFKSGYARVYYKYLNDRAIGYLPMPMQVKGTNDKPEWSSIAGFDALNGTVHSANFGQNVGLGGDNQLRRSNMADGMHPESHAIGTEFSFHLGDGWSVENRARMSFNKGRFESPFPASVGTLASYTPAGGSLEYADNGAAVGTGNAGNGLGMLVHTFDTELNNFNNFMNDFKVSKNFGVVNVTGGYFKSRQNISMSWLWNSYLTDVNGDGTRLINAIDSNGVSQTQNGLVAYGVPAWGNCCQRNYDVAYDISAPYANIGVELENGLSIDASVRWDMGHATGSFAGAVQKPNYDMNGDGVISVPEQSVSAIDNANQTIVNYKYNYLSYSAGANYKLNDNQAVFGRYSHGGSAKADRLLFNGLNYTDGSKLNAKDLIDQAELGYKLRVDRGGLFVTGFYAKTTEEGGFEATTQRIIKNNYTAMGLEIEGTYNIAGFNVRGGLTLTRARINQPDSITTAEKTPRRQAAVILSLSPSYTYKNFSVGLNLYGTSKSFAQDNNELVLPGYFVVNAFVRYEVTKGLAISLNGNNLTNALGITEAEEGTITNGTTNYVRARSILGRSMNATIRYDF